MKGVSNEKFSANCPLFYFLFCLNALLHFNFELFKKRAALNVGLEVHKAALQRRAGKS